MHHIVDGDGCSVGGNLLCAPAARSRAGDLAFVLANAGARPGHEDLHIQSNAMGDVGARALAEAVSSPHSKMEKFCESRADAFSSFHAHGVASPVVLDTL